MGEYVRAASLAAAARVRWPSARIHFLLNRLAPYAAACPFEHTLLPASATLCTREVCDAVRRFTPHVTIFDNAGRTAQLRAVREAGSRAVFISARRRQRRKAFRLRWMRLLDEHWIAYPRNIAGDFGWPERLKLALRPDFAVRFLDVFLPEAAETAVAPRAPFALVLPGGGGKPAAVREFAAAAEGLSWRMSTVLVAPRSGAPPGAERPGSDALMHLGRLPLPQLVTLMRNAHLVLTNGGASLLQAIACGTATIAAPIAHDQPERIERCVSLELARAAPLRADGMLQACMALLDAPAQLVALASRARAAHLIDGTRTAMDALQALLDRDGQRVP